MDKLSENILNINKVICDNITLLKDVDRGILSQNILSQLRNFIEAINLKIYSLSKKDVEIDWNNIPEADTFVAKQGKYRFLTNFYNLIEESKSHYTPNDGNAERLMLKYYEFLLKIKVYLKKEFDLEVLQNIEDFPLEDNRFAEYYEKIANEIKNVKSVNKALKKERYYIHKVKPFFIDQTIYYEITLSLANDFAGKFDRTIAFTNIDMMNNYSVKISFEESSIEILNRKMPIKIITDYEVSIRPCEIKNYAKIFHIEVDPKGSHSEYKNLMNYLTVNNANMLDLLHLDKNEFSEFKNVITKDSKVLNIIPVIENVRSFLERKRSGYNVVKYLLYRLNNKVIIGQLKSFYNIDEKCFKLSDLNLSYGCKHFDTLPYVYSLCDHNPISSDLFNSIGYKGHEEELVARSLKINTESFGTLYTSKDDLCTKNDIQELIDKYNRKLDNYQQDKKICIYKNNFYIKSYEDEVIQIIDRLNDYTQTKGILGYRNAIEEWLENNQTKVVDEDKKNALLKFFENDNIAVIYGAAGTGKTTLIEYISEFFAEQDKLFIANTNPAVNNMKRRIKQEKSTFKTIAKYTKERVTCYYDLLVVDECSTVSNADMLKIINKGNFRYLILVGDIYQIESVSFGNWFGLCKYFLPSNVCYELTKTYRCTDSKLLKFWDSIRNISKLKLDNITEQLSRLNLSANIDESIFEKQFEDEIILCLNYDGLYGINNINRFLQSDNENTPFNWGIWTYKVNDPILFNETKFFAPIFYNNLKGKINDIKIYEDFIEFEVTVDRVLTAFDFEENGNVEFIDYPEKGKTKVRFKVNKSDDGEEDDDMESNKIVPFQIAYAISIHKAQGLEYDSVKVVINDEVEDMISHNIFYTAITRAKKSLKIYWSPECQEKILKELKPMFNNKDSFLIKSRMEERKKISF